jgi:hypothetical protein
MTGATGVYEPICTDDEDPDYTRTHAHAHAHAHAHVLHEYTGQTQSCFGLARSAREHSISNAQKCMTFSLMLINARDASSFRHVAYRYRIHSDAIPTKGGREDNQRRQNTEKEFVSFSLSNFVKSSLSADGENKQIGIESQHTAVSKQDHDVPGLRRDARLAS